MVECGKQQLIQNMKNWIESSMSCHTHCNMAIILGCDWYSAFCFLHPCPFSLRCGEMLTTMIWRHTSVIICLAKKESNPVLHFDLSGSYLRGKFVIVPWPSTPFIETAIRQLLSSASPPYFGLCLVQCSSLTCLGVRSAMSDGFQWRWVSHADLLMKPRFIRFD